MEKQLTAEQEVERLKGLDAQAAEAWLREHYVWDTYGRGYINRLSGRLVGFGTMMADYVEYQRKSQSESGCS